MGLLNARNLKKAKAALDNNRDKVADVVGKAATGLDKATKGKTSGVSAKATAAARKYAGEDTTATQATPTGDAAASAPAASTASTSAAPQVETPVSDKTASE